MTEPFNRIIDVHPATTLAEAYDLMAKTFPSGWSTVWIDRLRFAYYCGAMGFAGLLQTADGNGRKMMDLLDELAEDTKRREEAFKATRQ